YRYRHHLDEVCVSDRQSFGFFAGADEDLQGYGANFGALIEEWSPFTTHPVAVQRTHGDTSIGSSPTMERVEANALAEALEFPSQGRRSSPTSAPSRKHARLSGARARRRTRPRAP